MAITKFEEIEAWQLARVLCRKVHGLTMAGGLGMDFSLKDQIQRSSGSVMDYIAEGFDAGGNNDFVRFLSYSKRSCSEVQSQLHRILDRGYCTQAEFDELYESTRIIRAKIGALIQYLQSSERRSPASLQPKATKQPGTGSRAERERQPQADRSGERGDNNPEPRTSHVFPTGNREP